MKVRHMVDEKVLLFQLKVGKEQAFEQLYHLYSLRLYGFLLKLVKDEEIAQDLHIHCRPSADRHTARMFVFRRD